MAIYQHCKKTHLSLLTVFALSGCISLSVIAEVVDTVVGTVQYSLSADNGNERNLLSANSGSNDDYRKKS